MTPNEDGGMTEASAVYAGSFDPPTWGHMDIISQATEIFNKVCILIAGNPRKKYMFTPGERVRIWEEILLERWLDKEVIVRVLPPDTYTAMWARDQGYTHLVRGLRNTRDFEEEIVMQDTNMRIWSPTKTAYFISRPEYRTMSSSLVKDIIGYKWWTHLLDNLVPHSSAEAVLKKLHAEREE
jgi:pantetheine-phosphate adenylyltransferase